jgi:hypothetical protein
MSLVKARREKLLAMCDAQCASLRSRLERRVNRVPNNKRKMKIIDILEPPAPQKAPVIKKVQEAQIAPAPAPAQAPTQVPNGRRVRTAQTATYPVPAPPPKPTTKPITKSSRGVKRSSDEMSSEDKENNSELNIPKKRVRAVPAKATTTTTAATSTKTTTVRATRTTRAASRTKKADPAPQVLSPKTNNSRPASQTRARRQR